METEVRGIKGEKSEEGKKGRVRKWDPNISSSPYPSSEMAELSLVMAGLGSSRCLSFDTN